MIELTWELEGETQLARRLNGLSEDIKDLKSEFKESADFIRNFSENEVFNTEGAVLGEKWKSGPSYNRLQRTGTMRRSFMSEATRDYGRVWNATDYFKYHQSRSLPRRKLPRRIMLKLVEQLKSQIVQIFHKGIYYKMKKNF